MDRFQEEQLSKLPPEERAEYFRYRRKAVFFGLAQLWTFPVFSWPTLFMLLFPLNANAYMAEKVTYIQVMLGGALPLLFALAIFSIFRKDYAKKAAALRTGADLL